jgi:hypothetical protein
MTEIELIEKAAIKVGMTSLLNHGAASCVYSEGCHGVTQEHLVAFAREVALHCAAALSTPPTPEAEPVQQDTRVPIDPVGRFAIHGEAMQAAPTKCNLCGMRYGWHEYQCPNSETAQQEAPSGEDRYWTKPAESLMGIALRELGDESRWTEIRDLNAASFPNMRSCDYYPVGTALKMPRATPAPQDTKGADHA